MSDTPKDHVSGKAVDMGEVTLADAVKIAKSFGLKVTSGGVRPRAHDLFYRDLPPSDHYDHHGPRARRPPR